MNVLGIESTCDETACAVVQDGSKILSNIISSQIDLHKEYGGVVPELACRRHVDILFPVIDEALQKAGITLEQIDLIAVAQGPGLIGALLIGMQAAKSIAFATGKPFVGVNHIEAHLYAAYMSQTPLPPLPCLGVVVSGGHTAIVKIEELGRYEPIGQSIDDAIGEAFDKVAKILGFPYPGGPIIEQLAKKGDPHRYPFKSGRVKTHPYHFSFSGLKTAVLYAVKPPHQEKHEAPDAQTIADIAASFQKAAFDDVIHKVIRAANETGYSNILLGGGVTNSQTFRSWFKEQAPHLNLFWPSSGLSLDNAAMIAGLGFHQYRLTAKSAPWDLEPLTHMPL